LSNFITFYIIVNINHQTILFRNHLAVNTNSIYYGKRGLYSKQNSLLQILTFNISLIYNNFGFSFSNM